MNRALVLAACAACKSGHGADVEISAADGLDVEVFVAPDECQGGDQVPTCSNDLAWDTVSATVHGNRTNILDIDERTIATPLGGGRYRLVLDGQDGRDEKIDRILVVGFAQGQAAYAAKIRDVVIPGNGEERWDLPLAKVQDIPPGDPAPASDGRRIHAWARADATRARCVVAEQWQNGQVDREYYLPAADTDCDDVPAALECAPYFYRDNGFSTIDRADCAAGFPWPANQLTCELGGPGCNEVMPSTLPSCTEIQPRYCAADGFCESACRIDLPGCVVTGQIAAVRCDVVVADTGAACGSTSYTTTVSLGQLLGSSTQIAPCMPPRFADAGPQPMFAPMWTPAGGGPTLTSIGSQAGGICDFGLQLDVTAGTTPHVMLGYLDLPLANGRHEVVPIELVFTFGCTSGTLFSCQLANLSGGDSITNCATAPP